MHARDAVAVRETTLNERLTEALSRFTNQCERIEAVLGRVNGTPQRIEGAKGSPVPTPPPSLQNNVDTLDGLVERLGSLTNGVERIA